MKSAGICFGSSTLQIVELEKKDNRILITHIERIIHAGNPAELFLSYISSLKEKEIQQVCVTGRSARKYVALSSISEPEAVEYALSETYKGSSFPDAVMSSGGETQLVYIITKKGGISSVLSGNKCASGSGEFFLQQIRRIGLNIDDAVKMAQAGTPYKIAGRCSVFCKSDCTHALNKGEDKKNIVAGLCQMMADKLCDLIKNKTCKHIAFIGGGALNSALVEILKKRFERVDIPEPKGCFEAYGAALWALKNETKPLPTEIDKVITTIPCSFGEHKPLQEAIHLVEFKKSQRGVLQNGDICILGLDVGSTTTKAVLMRRRDCTIVASVYLRTDGNPVEAAKKCYRVIKEQIGDKEIVIEGLGVTGSGRQVAALHALTDNVINEITAHATAAAYFSKDVDTIFEIGGQDAKYTFLTEGIPSDYAMNEACSAGTGSFLEEAAKESLNVDTENIAECAFRGKHPPNFTDQCAAFIGSDIKLAAQEGIEKDDILAGLVYSICLNYLNRVKGARQIGKKIFMQGGVCYNKAVPVAMASLLNRKIVVPPDPGLMGAYGVALVVEKRLKSGETQPKNFNLDTLISREAIKEGSFICSGGKEKCDRKCTINKIKLDGKIYPFGGICNKYYNIRTHHNIDTTKLDYVAIRQKLLFEEFGILNSQDDSGKKKIGIMRSFLTYTLFPLYSHFFDRLGFSIVMPEKIDPVGIAKCTAPFCLPAEISHGSFQALLSLKPDYIFLPQVMQIPVANVPTYSRICVFVQGEPYYLKSTFRKEIEEKGIKILSPILRMDTSYEAAQDKILEMAKELGVDSEKAKEAYIFACKKQREFEEKLLEIGKEALEGLQKGECNFGIVIFGRPYNSFTNDINMGIPHKIASHGIMAIPFDMLPAADYPVHHKMFWASGQKIMKAAQFVKQHSSLFGCFITNFSCGPDSFLIGYFRKIMGNKPSLTLELDEHTADAGIDTRIEAAIDIMSANSKRQTVQEKIRVFRPAKVFYEKEGAYVITSHGRKLPLNHPDVEVVFPSMGRYATESVAAVTRSIGINGKALPVPNKDVLLEGRSCTTCKECLPYILTTGSFMKYIKQRENSWKTTLFFLPTGGGPCRLGQYFVALENLIEKEEIENAAVLTLTDENSYAGLGSNVLLKVWQSVVVSDVFNDIRSVLSVAAKNREEALQTLEKMWQELLIWFEGKLTISLEALLTSIANRLKNIPLLYNPEELPAVSIVGEIYVRREEFSRKNIVDYLEDHGFIVRVAPVGEYFCYSNYVINNGLGEKQFSLQEKIKLRLIARIQEWWEQRIKSILAQSGLYKFELIDVEETIKGVAHLINENYRGEAILTVGLAMREILKDSCGIIAIGPFGCMPSRVAEAILKNEMNPEGKARMPNWEKKANAFSELGAFPFLSIETDGSPFPQLVEANLEAFILQARRLHEKMKDFWYKKEEKRVWKHLPFLFFELITGRKQLSKRKEIAIKSEG
ncbi:MAG: acyl-CoA dehydratase activase [Chitinispirillaceae bacterium]|nr:acyl-CoA dehydratase activase [Chitinispirillaceae bacterium]